MESESDDQLGEAEIQLRRHNDVSAMVDRRGPSRALASLEFWNALVMSVYFSLALFASNGRFFDIGGVGRDLTPAIVLLLFPMLIFSGLLNGAKERFSIRRKPSRSYWIVYVVIAVVIAVLLTSAFVYPWWLNLLAPAALFGTMAVGPSRILLSGAKTRENERWTNTPLTGSERWTMVLIGVVLGVLAATSTQSWLSTFVMVIAGVCLLGFFVWASLRVLPHPGYAWGPGHWTAFGVSMSVLFVMALLLVRTDWITPLLALIAGILVFSVMTVGSLLPRAPKR